MAAHGIAIIGTGMIANFHVKAIADIRKAKVIACYDFSQERAEQFAKENDCIAYDSLKELLANDDVTIVSVCTPSGAHQEPAVAAAKAGKHVIVEKPLEITLKRCDAIINACEANNVKLASIFPSRFHAPVKIIKNAIDKNRFGKLTIGDAIVKWYRTQDYYDSGAWRGTWALDGGGALMNQAIHSVDLLAYLMGPVKEIVAFTDLLAHERIEVEDTAVATLRFESGAVGVIEATTAAYPGYLKRIEIHGSKGSAVMEEEDIIKWDFEKPTKKDKQIQAELANRTESGGGASDPSAIGYHGHTEQFKDFIKAIEKDTIPFIDGYEGRRSVEIILSIYKAAETGRVVQLPLKKDPVLKAKQNARKLK